MAVFCDSRPISFIYTMNTDNAIKKIRVERCKKLLDSNLRDNNPIMRITSRC